MRDEEATTCDAADDVRKLLRGDLADAATRRTYAHLRGCLACRRTLQTERQVRGALRAFVGVDASRPDDPTPVAGAAAATDAPPGRGRPRLLSGRRGLLLGVGAILLLGWAGGALRKPTTPVDDDSFESLARRALARGGSVVASPAGAQDGRPRVAVVLLPTPVATARLVVTDASCAVAHERVVAPGAEGAFLEPHRLAAAGGTSDVWRLVVPFPEAAALPLAPGAAYGVTFLLPGGLVAASATFTLR